MKFNIKETVALATKGFKPADISELATLDDSKFDKDDILSLISSGYSKSDIIKLVDTFSNEENENDNNNDDDPNEQPPKKEVKKPASHDDEQDQTDNISDDIDYKELYNKEKKLREKLQHQNAIERGSEEVDKRTDEEIAVDVVKSILGG